MDDDRASDLERVGSWWKPSRGSRVIWVIGGLLAITTASAVILALARTISPNFRPSPWFLQHPLGSHAWGFAAWIPPFVSNILGEELCWRGYLLPR